MIIPSMISANGKAPSTSAPAILRHIGWLCLLVSCLIGCGRRDAGKKPNAEQANRAVPENSRIGATSASPETVSSTEPAATDRPATIPLSVLSLPGDELLRQSENVGWESEAIGDQASSKLHALGDAMREPKRLQKAIDELASADFRCGPLRPNTLSEAFRGEAVIVRRAAMVDGQAKRTGKAHPTHVGPAGLGRALRELVGSPRNAQTVRFEQKVVRVDFDETQAKTTSLVHVYSQTEDQRLQHNMVWDCRWNRSDGDELKLAELNVRDYEEVAARFGTQRPFSDCTEAAIGDSRYYREVLAFGFDHWLDRIEGRFGIFPTAWHGIAIGDANGDGLDDLYVCQPGGLPNGLFVAAEDGTAVDVATDAGVDLRDHTHSALLADLDNDGDQDLVLATLVGLVIFANDGQCHFTRQTTKLTPEGMPFSLSAADYDNDGDLDLYACCYSRRRSTVANQFVGIEGRPLPYHDANNGARNLLLRNNLDWQFPNVTQFVGLHQNNHRFSFAAAWEDYDNDGDQDLYVANDYGRNSLYRNDGGRFVDVAASTGVEDISAGMSVSWGDVDRDGWMDVYIANMFSSAGNRVTYQRRFQPGADATTRAKFQRHARGNSLFTNAGGNAFRDVSEPAAVTMGRWAWGSPLVDLNNDGLKDIVVANGFITQELPNDL